MLNIEVKVALDGEEIRVNNDLSELLTGIVNTYIKQKVAGSTIGRLKGSVNGGKLKTKTETDYGNTSKRGSMMPRWNEVELEHLRQRSIELYQSGMTTYFQIARELSPEFNRSAHAIMIRFDLNKRQPAWADMFPQYHEEMLKTAPTPEPDQD